MHKKIKAFTGAAYDWETKLIFRCKTREEAVYLQKHLNKTKGRTFLEKVLDKPQILQEILSER
ncbi:hypothetical protein [Salinimicrobium xinjiangense]|uniref:hypothetical protein n=1 Tax=Salinimicrobium xinjiangense TaxID=438596 RepID=UPI0004100A35|nr:hypothetical protein [Salinimicrobium xinjiangense]